MEIKIPLKFDKCLSTDPKWKRRVEDLTGSVKDVLGQATEFFPEYTEHGLLHVNTVLALAAELIPGRSIGKNTITPRDAACLIAAIVIHDLGMFLTPAGLDAVMSKQWDAHRNDKLDGHGWEDAWERYISAAKRLPQEQMKRCFGKMIQVEKTTLVKDRMTWDDKLVIGEFLRRNHPRLAQEIAVAGMPGTQLQHFLADAGFEPDERSVIGLMARSHGMSLREVEEYLGPEAYLSNMPVYYLMAILRLADYLDASRERAPMIRVKQEDLGSPLSKEEWALNRCFRIDSSRWFPEKKHYTIAANPETSSEYARLEKWLEHAQRELDLSWAALAEKYPDGRLKLSIHRIKCTMHEKLNHEGIADRILPREVKVTANPEIVKLMIEPLYGAEPTYGVRELLQNAVDACVERKEWERRHGNPDYMGLVDVRIDCGIFTITDNGMGMNEDILLNYYLSAGSSYRSSEAWKAANAPDGESRVARTGKFGVGFLAAFLLGDEIQVHTQHREDKKGYKFRFNQQAMPLDVERAARTNDHATTPGDQTGTTISIRLKSPTVKGSFSDTQAYPWYNWYAFDEPKVRYMINGRERQHGRLCLYRDPVRNDGWLTIPSDDFEVYQWKPNLEYKNPSEFYCNGIRIYGGLSNDHFRKHFQTFAPHLSVIDKSWRTKVDISRKTLLSIPDENKLFREVYRWHIARLLLTPWDTEEDCQLNCTLCFPFLHFHYSGRIPFLLSPRGFSLNTLTMLTALSLSEYVILYYDGSDSRSALQTSRQFLRNNVPCTIISSATPQKVLDLCPDEEQRFDDTPKRFLHSIVGNSPPLFNFFTIQYQVNKFVTSIWYKKGVCQPHQSSLPLAFHTQHKSGIVSTIFKNRRSIMPIYQHKFPITEFPVAVHVTPNYEESEYKWTQNTDALFDKTLREVLTPAPDYPDQDLWIPFDMEERKKKFPKAFEELKVYMDYIKKYPVD